VENNSDNIADFPRPGFTTQGRLRHLIDTRDSSVFVLQIILFCLALIEAIQALILILDPGESDPHTYAHLGSYMLAYAAALFVISFRPARARGLLVLVTAATVGFVLTAIVDVINGRTELAGEFPHVTKLIAPFVVWLIAVRTVPKTPRTMDGEK
jgi:hypothetical protein